MDMDIDRPNGLQELEERIAEKENSVPFLKPEAKASIIWADAHDKSQTPYSILYLHGFKASKGEGAPLHEHVAQALGANLYLARLARHGLNDPDAFKHMESRELKASAEEALHIARLLGRRVIIMGTSTGASLALHLASKEEHKDTLAALLLYSPLVRFYGIQHLILAKGLGRSLLTFLSPADCHIKSQNKTKEQERIWYGEYHIDGALALGSFIEETMKEDVFRNISCPVLTAYYHKNFWERDKVVSVSAIRKMHRQLGTDVHQKAILRLAGAGSHVISCGLVSKSISRLTDSSIHFLRNHLEPIEL